MKIDALVDPSQELTNEEIKRYARHILLPEIGSQGQQRIKNAKVLVIGAGGLGSPVLLYLAGAGVGEIGICEFDVVEESNLQRQIIHSNSKIGQSKAQSAKEKLLDLNCFISFSGIITFKKSENLRNVAKFVPLDSMMIETDSPFLSPEPFRGKSNNPSMVKYVAKTIAELKKLSINEIANKTTYNFNKFFLKNNEY